MAMNYKFANLLGAPYRGGNLVIQGSELLSAVGNRVSVIDLADNISSTLPFETIQQVRTLCVSPDGQLLLAIDETGRALLINKPRRALLHHISFRGPVAAARFSPDGRYVACAVGRTLQVWRAPTCAKVVAPLQLHRTYGGSADLVTCLDWSADSLWIAIGCKDLTCRVYSLHPTPDYRPATLAGHKSSIVGVYFAGAKIAADAALEGLEVPALYSVSRDGAVHGFSYIVDDACRPTASTADASQGDGVAVDGTSAFAGGEWKLSSKQYLMQRSAKVSAVELHRNSGLLLVAFTSGTFDLYQMPAFQHLHALSVTRHRITAATFNESGNWVALGCAELGQLLVWDWRPESYVLKQQGHSAFIAAAAFSPNGLQLATAADDSKVKVWSLSTGICSVTFSDHASAVTALAWLPSGGALLSASLDGTVRAFDLVRYRNFRTFTSPQPVQFSSMAVDPSGEIVCAGSLDTFQIFVWSVKTGRLLDILAAHEGPVVALAFSPTQALLASVSWDRTLRTWDVFSGKGGIEVLQHSHDVLALAFRPDGKQIATATLDGQIHFWDPAEGELQGTIEGRRDIAGGRLMSDRRSAANSTSGQCFSSLAYSADGSFLMAGGRSKFVCLYGVQERMLMRRFQLSHNQSLDGVLDQLNSKNVTDAGPVQLVDDDDSADESELLGPAGGPTAGNGLPGAAQAKAAVISCRAVALSPTGSSWVAATTEGALLYSLDDGSVFDPTDLAEDVTVEAARRALNHRMYLKALLLALRLKEAELLEHVLLSTPENQVAFVAASVPTATVVPLLTSLAGSLATSPHLEFMLAWLHALCMHHGNMLQVHGSGSHSAVMPALRAVQKSLFQVHEDISTACQTNVYTLRYLCDKL